jgi:hypothetical protein
MIRQYWSYKPMCTSLRTNQLYEQPAETRFHKWYSNNSSVSNLLHCFDAMATSLREMDKSQNGVQKGENATAPVLVCASAQVVSVNANALPQPHSTTLWAVCAPT